MTKEGYCVQFYVNKRGEITLIGVTQQLVSPEGNYLGGLIDYTDDLSRITQLIAAIGHYAHQQGYFGVIGSMSWKIGMDSFIPLMPIFGLMGLPLSASNVINC